MNFVILVLIIALMIDDHNRRQFVAATPSYTVTARRALDTPVISFSPPLKNSVFEYSYNPAAFINDQNELCLVVRCQNSTSTTNPLGAVGPSQLSISCVTSQSSSSSSYTSNFTPITDSSVIFRPQTENEILGTEDPRILKVKSTLYMFYTAVTPAPDNQGATARLSLATCDNVSDAANPGCWRRQGQLFPDSRPGFQFTKSGALLHDPEDLSKPSYLIFGDCSIINGLQVARTTDFIHYDIIDNFLLIEPRPGFFDNGIVESGPPPLKIPGTGDWLFIYNAAQKLYGTNNNLFYNPGYVILNGSNPQQVLQRSDEPLLMPSYHFETQGLTPYVVFVEGMVQAPASNSSSSFGHNNKQKPLHKISRHHKEETHQQQQEVSFYLFYGAGDNDVAVAEVTISY